MTFLVHLNDHVVTCVLARTPSELALGLQRHASLGPNEGMLFLFSRPRKAAFHMGNVRFPIDIIGLDENSQVTRIVEGAMPGSTERWHFARVAAVLEVPGGTCRRASLKVGDIVASSEAVDKEAGVHETFNKEAVARTAMPIPSDEELPPGYSVRVETEYHDLYASFFLLNPKDIVVAEVAIRSVSGHSGHSNSRDYQVIYSKNRANSKPWGAYLYEKALEWVTSKGGYLMPDDTLSPLAERVWRTYHTKRDDVESSPAYRRRVHMSDIPFQSKKVWDKKENPHVYRKYRLKKEPYTASLHSAAPTMDAFDASDVFSDAEITPADPNAQPADPVLQEGDRFKVGRFGPTWIVVRSMGATGYVQREGHKRKWHGFSHNRDTGEIAVYPVQQGSGDRTGDPVAFGPVNPVIDERKAQQLLELEDTQPDEPLEDHEPHRSTEPGGKQYDQPKEKYFSDLWGDTLANEALDVRPELQTRSGQTRSGQTRLGQIVDESKFVSKVADVLFAHANSIPWQPDVLNGGASERAVITRAELARWLKGSEGAQEGAEPSTTSYILQAASNEQGLRLVGSAFVLAELADFSRLGFAGKQPTLVLYRQAQ